MLNMASKPPIEKYVEGAIKKCFETLKKRNEINKKLRKVMFTSFAQHFHCLCFVFNVYLSLFATYVLSEGG